MKRPDDLKVGDRFVTCDEIMADYCFGRDELTLILVKDDGSDLPSFAPLDGGYCRYKHGIDGSDGCYVEFDLLRPYVEPEVVL